MTNATEERTLGCISGKESLLISPLIYWTERDIWEFLNNVVQVPHCELYDQGFHRIGCIGCPMSNRRQKLLENRRWPHVRRHWIKTIMAIRHGGGTQRMLTDSNPVVRYWNLLGGYIAHPDPCHWIGKSGFSSGSSPDGLTDEQEYEIAENIYDWWISGKSYRKWYADKFMQMKFDFEYEDRTY